MLIIFVLSRLTLVFCFWWIVGKVIYYWREHRAGIGEHKDLLAWFIALFVMAGLTRIVELVDYLDNRYELPSVITSTLTAIIAIKIVIDSGPFIRDVLRLPSVHEFNTAVERLQEEKTLKEKALREQETLSQNLKIECKKLTYIIDTEMWVTDKSAVLGSQRYSPKAQGLA